MEQTPASSACRTVVVLVQSVGSGFGSCTLTVVGKISMDTPDEIAI
jgi:hypothetical protein